MTKAQKKQLENFLKLLEKAHKGIRKALETRNADIALDILIQCQEGIIEQGGMIEEAEGEGTKTVSLMEDYCEVIFQVHEEIAGDPYTNPSKIYNKLNSSLIQIENSVRKDISVRTEIVFLPYKASMWDSLESVWMAADADPGCNAYVVPIPYYDKNPDGSLGIFHYEGDDFPEYVPITHYDTYRVEVRRPDVIYIHNPYDHANYVTTIDPRFYSHELKQYTDLLVYIPYYVTSGGMNESRGYCPAYYNADYIMIQAEKYRHFFDKKLPKNKLQALGSPKFDRVIRMCSNPGEPPIKWKEKMICADGTKKMVYFYNTSINGMLANTRKFLQKMEYVFKCFQGREDTCLLWRPHPLLETTFKSMRKEYYPIYLKLKSYFTEYGLGIYDDTPDVEKTISFCDAYIGDDSSSLIILFGISGKPLFILNNNIDREPGPEDWRGEIINDSFLGDRDEWVITQGNKLYRTTNRDYHYRYVCDLSDYAYGGYYLRVIESDGKAYACPRNAQDIVVIKDGRTEKRILLERFLERTGAFCSAWKLGGYIFLIPNKYPAIVRYDIDNDKVDYIRGYNDVFIGEVQGVMRVGGGCVRGDTLFLVSPVEDKILSIDSKTMQTRVCSAGVKQSAGWSTLASDGSDLWMLPYEGGVIARWNPETGEVQEYSGLPEGYQCINQIQGYVCMEQPFGMPAFSGDYVYLPPYWGNMYLRLNKESGKIEEWTPPFPVAQEEKNCYYLPVIGRAEFLNGTNRQEKSIHSLFSRLDKKLYEVDLEHNRYTEINIEFDIEELRSHHPGFYKYSEWLQYACREDTFYSLKDFLDGTIIGASFEQERQLRAYSSIIANGDGTCGEKIHEFIKGKL